MLHPPWGVALELDLAVSGGTVCVEPAAALAGTVNTQATSNQRQMVFRDSRCDFIYCTFPFETPPEREAFYKVFLRRRW